MTIEIEGKEYLTDNDLKISVIGSFPGTRIRNRRLRKIFKEQFGRDYLSGDEIIAYSQALVSRGMNFENIEEAMLTDIAEGKNLRETIFKKNASGIGRGHSLGGLAGLVLGIDGTKMLDSGLTGFCMSRSLITSSRRREVTEDDIAIPECLVARPELLSEYLEISKDVFRDAETFKAQKGKMRGVETFNKVLPNFHPANLIWVAALDTLAGLAQEVRWDKKSSEQFLPRELHSLVDMLPEVVEKSGMGTMYKQRLNVPRGTYLHYSVFKDPSDPNYALECSNGSLEPRVIEVTKDFTSGFYSMLARVLRLKESAMKETDPAKLTEKAMDYVCAMNVFLNEYNDALRVKVSDSLSWRVWGEQKRHATLRQNVESVYSAANKAYEVIKEMWPKINARESFTSSELEKLDEAIIIEPSLRGNQELLGSYVYHTAKQLMFYGKLIDEGIEARDALFIVPKNIRMRTLETLDLSNGVGLELPLRLCFTCEPERYETSWKKREVIARAVPILAPLLEPKCGVGYCTEGKPCKHIMGMRDGYSMDFHNAVTAARLSIS